MRKTIAAIMAMLSFGLFAADGEVITNKIYIVSNVYYRVFTTNDIVNNIHTFHTNHEFHIDHQTLVVSQTNINTTATFDMGRSMLSIMSNDVNTAKASIQSTADAASGSASSASAAASRASSSAASAQGTLNSVNTRGSEIINAMNAKQTWFDQNYGKMITNHNIYVAEDSVARAGVAQNAADIAEAKQCVTDSFAYTTAVSNKMENGVSDAKQGVIEAKQGVAEAKQGVTDSFAYTTAVSNKIEKMNKIYNDGSGYSMWMEKMPLMQTIKVYRSGYLLVTVTFDPSKYIDNVSGGSFEYTDFTRTPTSLAPHSTPSDFRLYKSKSNNRFLMIDRYNQSSSSTMSYTIYWNTGSSDPTNVGTGNGMSGTTGISGTSSREEFEQTPYYVLSDLTIRKADKTIITKIVTEMALNAISNWVEQTFQKK